MAKVKDEEQNSVPSSRACSSSTYSHLGPGGTYLDFWTRALEQYKQMRDASYAPARHELTTPRRFASPPRWAKSQRLSWP
jgi:hypothetical protein